MKYKLLESLIALLLLSAIIIIVINSKNRINVSNIELNKAYEKGLYDGFFRTVTYIDSMNYFKLGNIKFTEPEVDSLLHKKLN
jgi:hypothetical protein